MSGQLDSIQRRIVPRWRPSPEQARINAETRTTDQSESDSEAVAHLVEQLRRSCNVYVASDLLGAAQVLGARAEAEEAARFIIAAGSAAPGVAREFARWTLEGAPWTGEGHSGRLLGQGARRKRASRLRSILRISGRNPLAWLDLAREQASLGQTDAALRPVRIALGLAPDSRLVLRSASRYFLHAEDRERAHEVLRCSARVETEPTLLAAEIATASAAGRTSSLVKRGRRLLSSRDFSARELSELAAAIGTLEAEAGARRAAKRLLHKSLEDPTENALAQCSWLEENRALGSFAVPEDLYSTPMSFEANALERMASGEYARSVDASYAWLQDEPFASRPAAHGSFLSSMVLGEYSQAADFALEGLVANPHDPVLLNNAAFSFAADGRLEEAGEYLHLLERTKLDAEHLPMRLATAGFIAYREGRPLAGRELYLRAVEKARDIRRDAQVVWALLLCAGEEDRLQAGSGTQLREEANRYIGRLAPLDRAIAEVLQQTLVGGEE